MGEKQALVAQLSFQTHCSELTQNVVQAFILKHLIELTEKSDFFFLWGGNN